MSAPGPKPVNMPTSKRNSAFHGLHREETIADIGFSKEADKHTFYDLGQANGVVPPDHPKYVE